jgi:rare lipoprotein A
LAVFVAVAALLWLSACTGLQSGKSVDDKSSGRYKVGEPYQIKGVWYYPAADFNYDETGIASWYGPGFHGKTTANGERYDQEALTAAHRTLPMPSVVRVTNLENGRSIMVRVNDRGPFANGRIIDMSSRGAELLGFRRQGTAKVRVEIMETESRQLAAIARSEPRPASERPKAAPVAVVTAETLSGDPAPVNTVGTTASDAAPQSTVQVASVQTSTEVTQYPVSPSAIFVQAGAFTQRANANRLAKNLAPHGEVHIQPAMVGGTQFYRVQLGPMASVSQADSVLAKLIENGYTGSRVVVR